MKFESGLADSMKIGYFACIPSIHTLNFLYRYLSVKKISGIKTSQKRLDISLECFSNHKCWETPTFCHDYVFCCRFFNPSHAIQRNRTHLATPPEISGDAPQWRYVRWSHQWPKPVDRQEMEIDLEVIAAKYTLEAKREVYQPLRIQVCPKKGIDPTILLWGWDWDHQTYSREGYGSLGKKWSKVTFWSCSWRSLI